MFIPLAVVCRYYRRPNRRLSPIREMPVSIRPKARATCVPIPLPVRGKLCELVGGFGLSLFDGVPDFGVLVEDGRDELDEGVVVVFSGTLVVVEDESGTVVGLGGDDEEDGGTVLSGMVVSGIVVAGNVVSGTVVSGSVVAGKVVSGSVVSGRVVAGSVVAGRVVSGNVVGGRVGSHDGSKL